MITLTELKNGNLKITLNDKESLKELLDKGAYDSGLLFDMLEDAQYIGNNWYVVTDIPLTEAPVIGYGAIYDDEDSEDPDDYEKMWFFGGYMLKCFGKELLKTGEFVFTKLNKL